MDDLSKRLDNYEKNISYDTDFTITGWTYMIGYLEVLSMSYPFRYETHLRISRLKDKAYKMLCKRGKADELIEAAKQKLREGLNQGG